MDAMGYGSARRPDTAPMRASRVLRSQQRRTARFR